MSKKGKISVNEVFFCYTFPMIHGKIEYIVIIFQTETLAVCKVKQYTFFIIFKQLYLSSSVIQIQRHRYDHH